MDRITICARTGGVPLFDQIWSWKEDQKKPQTTSALIQFFYQFAKDVGGGSKYTRRTKRIQHTEVKVCSERKNHFHPIHSHSLLDIIRIQFSRPDPPNNASLKKRTYPSAYPRFQQQRQTFRVSTIHALYQINNDFHSPWKTHLYILIISILFSVPLRLPLLLKRLKCIVHIMN